MAIAVFIYYWWDIYVLGLRFLAQPAVTSANEVLTQTSCRQRSAGSDSRAGLITQGRKGAKLHKHVQNRTPEQNMGRSHSQSQVVFVR